MGIGRTAIETLAKAVIATLPKRCLTTAERANSGLPAGDATFSREPGAAFTCGFGKAVLTPDDIESGTYYIAGYDSNNPAKAVLDDMYARAVYLDDGTGRGGVVLCAVDCVGLSRKDVNDIRRAVLASGEAPLLKSINIAATHSHSAVDTQGLWGPKITKSGRNEAFMQTLKTRVAGAVLDACRSAVRGRLFYGVLKTDGLQADVREPETFDPNLTKILFRGDDGSETVLVNFAAHAELMGSKTTAVSADYPAYMIREIEQSGPNVNAVFFNGAIGGMISAKEIKKVYRHEIDCEAYAKAYGKTLGELVNGLACATEIEPLVNAACAPVALPADNFALILARRIGVLNNDIARGGKRSAAVVFSETGYLELGCQRVGLFLVPGELFPELWNGAFLSAAESATGAEAHYRVLNTLGGCDHRFVVGLCNDELGYILPDNDFLTDADRPYLNAAHDRHGRRHYEETNSLGPATARALLDATAALIDAAQAAQ